MTDIGQTMSFAGSSGETVVYELVAVESSEPAVQYGSGDVVACTNTSSLTFSTGTGNEELTFRFWQLLRDEPVEQSMLELSLYRTHDGIADDIALHSVFLNESDYENNNDVYSSTTSTSYVPVGIVNGVEYQTVITSQRNEDSAPIQAPTDSETALTRVVFAKEFGLVQMELQGGVEFNRVD